jgi:DNA-binding transcriptional ArsR family regulator
MEEICCVDMPVDNQINSTVEFLKIIAEENRLKILCMLLNGELCVCDIWQYLNIPQNLTSHHLKVLKDFGLLNARKEGLNVYYSINHANLSHAKKMLDDFLTGKRRAC